MQDKGIEAIVAHLNAGKVEVKQIMARDSSIFVKYKGVSADAIAKYNSIIEELVPGFDLNFPPPLWTHAML